MQWDTNRECQFVLSLDLCYSIHLVLGNWMLFSLLSCLIVLCQIKIHIQDPLPVIKAAHTVLSNQNKFNPFAHRPLKKHGLKERLQLWVWKFMNKEGCQN